MIVYKITNLTNGKIYVGRTKKSIEKRFKEHVREASYNCKYYFHKALRKYGSDNFSLEILEENDFIVENKREEYWIEKLNANDHSVGYNISTGGEGSGDNFTNNPNKEEIRKRMSEAHRGKKLTDDHKKKIGNSGKEAWKNTDRSKRPNPRKGKSHTDEAKEKIRNSRFGKKFSDEAKLKMSESHRGKVLTEEHKMKIKESLKKYHMEK
jgi:group I intron endonuclease